MLKTGTYVWSTQLRLEGVIRSVREDRSFVAWEDETFTWERDEDLEILVYP